MAIVDQNFVMVKEIKNLDTHYPTGSARQTMNPSFRVNRMYNGGTQCFVAVRVDCGESGCDELKDIVKSLSINITQG